MKVIHIHLFLPFIHALRQESKGEDWDKSLNLQEEAEENGEGKEIINFWGFSVFHAKPQQRKWQRWNDLQWPEPRSVTFSVDQCKGRNFTDMSDLLDKQ